MKSYKLDFIDNDVKATESVQPFNLLEGMSFILSDDTHIFLTHNFIHEMNERIEDLNADYEDEILSDSLPNYIEV